MSPIASFAAFLCVLTVGALFGATALWYVFMRAIQHEPAQFGAFLSNCMQSLALSAGQTHVHFKLGPMTQIALPDGRVECFTEELPVAIPVQQVCLALRHELPTWIAHRSGARE